MHPVNYLPGPATVRENVRFARAQEPPGIEVYGEAVRKLKHLVGTEHELHILCGEGMVALDAAVCSLVEPGDDVLVITNGVFGSWFEDLVARHRGIPTVLACPWERPVSPATLDAFLRQTEKSFKVATLVHCDTPTGVLNDVRSLVSLLMRRGILTIVDSVSAAFATPLEMDAWGIDVLLLGSQKVLSCPTGLAMVAVSARAWAAIETRNTPIAGYYTNLLLFKGCVETGKFPYALPNSELAGLLAAINNIIQETPEALQKRHRTIAAAVRTGLQESGLRLFLDDGYSPTVTAFRIPEGVTAREIVADMQKLFNITITCGLDSVTDTVIRLGHLGENARVETTLFVLKALGAVFSRRGVPLRKDPGEVFFREYCKIVGINS
ncbi:Serine-pyruvate aminotransferase [Giardia muris]|uniref:alanine--glyoxylate transaminase n=1 Tax=Giardia muris TaxID=5742 RepID=A0A4Z1T1J9_GIAMU|nr:Serine-pyruvate aminotransferase [Giardia muris]|eukprot:TNJ26817.1 Serine-pyruvate aminotransferase [Giardia muris]